MDNCKKQKQREKVRQTDRQTDADSGSRQFGLTADSTSYRQFLGGFCCILPADDLDDPASDQIITNRKTRCLYVFFP